MLWVALKNLVSPLDKIHRRGVLRVFYVADAFAEAWS